MGIKSSVSLYSLQYQFLLGKMDLGQIIEFVMGIGADGIEILPDQMLHGTPATVRVLKEGGLSKGEHEVHLTVCTRTAYIPVPLEGNMTRKVII